MKTVPIDKAGAVLLIALFTAGCATPRLGGGDYSQRQVRTEQEVRLGVIEALRDVRIDARDTGTGATAGAVLGGIAGSTVGGGHRANAAGAVAGAVIGGIIGHNVEASQNERRGVEITVKLDGGRMIAITQEADEQFRVGDRVRVLSSGKTSRVTRM
jgi:outer membrane lipoprotein SlyB